MLSNKDIEDESFVINAVEYLENENNLHRDAYKSMPYKFDKCTYDALNVNRQIVYSCLDCKNIGVCYSCSISCGHCSHNLIDIGYKKGFICDCGTDKDLLNDRCSLYPNSAAEKEHEPNNRYGHNFQGRYCYCDKGDDADSGMVQCQLGNVCNEDWYHIKCIALKNNNVEKEDFEDFICSLCFEEYEDLFHKLFKAYKDYDWFISIKVNKTQSTILLKKEYSNKLKIILAKEKLKNISSDLSKFLGVLVYKDIVDPYLYYEPPKDHFESIIKVDDVNYVTDEDDYSAKELNAISRGMNGKDINFEKFHDFKNVMKSFLRDFAERNEVIKKEDVGNFFSNLKSSTSRKRSYDDLDEDFSDPENDQDIIKK